jgi:hypothetical protein
MKLTCPKCGKILDTSSYDVGRLNLRAEHSYTGGEDNGCTEIWFQCDCGYKEYLGCAVEP